MSRVDENRLIVRIARMYYNQEMSQPNIAKQLGLSQATVSRLLNRAKEEGIIRISVTAPPGVFSQLEETLIQKYGLRDAIVVECIENNDEKMIHQEIGSAAAYYIESAIRQNEVIGISSWSSTLLAMVDSLHPIRSKTNIRVVQILGGVGNPSAEVHAARLTGRFTDLVGGSAIFLPAPGVVGSEATLNVLMDDFYVRQAMTLFNQVTTALVGIGAVEPSRLLAESGNIFSFSELKTLHNYGAVGDILLRFFDLNGTPVITQLDGRVVSMSLQQLRKVDRSIGMAGGSRKYEAILGSLCGHWINILITDRCTAERLVEEKS